MPLSPDPALARLHHANALLAHARAKEAAAEFSAVLDARPEWLIARHGLVRSLLSTGNFEGAFVAASNVQLFDARDAFAAVLSDLATTGASTQHADLLRAYVQRHPQDIEALLALAAAAHALGRPCEALRWSERVLAMQPQARSAREISAASLIDRGDVEAGLTIYHDLLHAGDAETAARYLVLMHYDPAQSNEGLFAAHHAFAQSHLMTRGSAFAPRPRLPSAKLRIGWLSPRFAGGPVTTFLAGLLRHLDRSRHHHLLIDLQPTGDASSQRLHALADEVIDAGRLDDAMLLKKLRYLDLDIVIDLAGHSTSNRLAVLAERVAPVQVCWLDWFDTTATPAMDAWISDAWLTPPDSSQIYSEQLIRLASGRLCYTPVIDAPQPARADGGAVVFGSFNRLAKFNDGVVDTWAEILRRVPDAQLELRARLLGDPETLAHIGARFAARGIGIERLRLCGELPYLDLLAAYQHIDIALDPFPFSGCTTTCDALWMGCPTITLPGTTFVSRQSASLLWRLGADEWVARDLEDYVERAVTAAANIESLRRERSVLRERVVVRLCNSKEQAVEFAHTLDELHANRLRAALP